MDPLRHEPTKGWIHSLGAFAVAFRHINRVWGAGSRLLHKRKESSAFLQTAHRYAALVSPDSPIFWGLLAIIIGCVAGMAQSALERNARHEAPSLVVLQMSWITKLLEGHPCKLQKEGWGTPLRETLPARTQLWVQRGKILFRDNPLSSTWSVWKCPSLSSPTPGSMGEPLPAGLPGLVKLMQLLPGPLKPRTKTERKNHDPREIRY
jgi:hypothetical protein